MKYLLIILFPLSLYAQGGSVATGGGSGGTRPVDDKRPLIEFLRDRNNTPSAGTLTGLTGGGLGGAGGGTIAPRTRTITLGGHSVTVSQDEMDAINTAGLRNNKREEVLPTRLHIESINLSSDEVSEITLKDGSVVKVEDLQEFVREKMKSKLNQ